MNIKELAMRKATMKFTPKALCLWAGLSLIAPLPAQAERSVSYSYTPQGQIETIDGPRIDVNDLTTYGYDSQGNRSSITNALSQTTQITAHDASGRPLTIISPNDLTTTRVYDPRGRLTQQNVSDGVTTRTTDYAYDAVGNLIQVSQPDGNRISYDYDAAHRLTGLEDQLGNRIDYTLDAMGNRLSEQVSDPLGSLTRTQQKVYDQLSQPEQQIDSQNHVTGYAYDSNGNLTQTEDANHHATTQSYDPLDRLSETTDALDGITRYSYDAQDNLISFTDPTGLTTSYDYDSLGNLISQSSPDTGTTSYGYDEAGNRLSQTDARGVITSYSYDALNRLTDIHYPDSTLDVHYSYDQGANGIGRLTRMEDSEGVTDYSYNAYGDLIEQRRTSQDGIITSYSYSYNPQGQLISQGYPSGNILHYSYSQGQLTGLSLETPEGDTQPLVSQIERLPFGPINALAFGNGLQLNRSYDQDYQLIAQSVGSLLSDSYNHDPVGNIIDWQDLLQSGRDQSFSYDQLDRLTSAIGAYGELGYSYDGVGNRLSKTENSESETYSYLNDSHRLQEILGVTSDSRQYDEAGNTLESLLGSYTYDDQNRMVGFTKAGTAASYGYNGKGERVRKSVNGTITRFRYSPQGELLGEYDQNGQMIREYVYLVGQPVAQIQETIGQIAIDFEQTTILSYAGASQDVAATVEGNSLSLRGNGWKKIAFPYTVTPNTILAFDFESSVEGDIHGIGFDTDDAISRDLGYQLYGSQDYGIQDYRLYSGSGSQHFEIPVGSDFTGEMQWLTLFNDHDVSNPTAESRFSHVRVYEADDVGSAFGVVYLHTDHLGAVVKATDETGIVVWDVERQPFGERVVGTELVEMPLGFPGQYFDQESGNFYNYFRDYDPTTGRYLQSDPIGLYGGINTYAYVGGNPLVYADPLGLFFDEAAYAAAIEAVATTTGVAVSTVAAAVVGVASAVIPSNAGEGSDIPQPDDDCDDGCDRLWKELRKWTQKFNQRAEDLRVDKCNQYTLAYSKPNPSANCGGNTTWVGHQQAIDAVQRRIKKLIDEAIKKGCPIPPGAWKAATTGIPQSPRGR